MMIMIWGWLGNDENSNDDDDDDDEDYNNNNNNNNNNNLYVTSLRVCVAHYTCLGLWREGG